MTKKRTQGEHCQENPELGLSSCMHTLSSMQEPEAKGGCPDWTQELVGWVQRCVLGGGVRGH